jgi:hypothetical protein
MDFENFAVARDFLYATAALLGLLLGCALHCVLSGAARRAPRFFKNRPEKSRNRLITAILCLLSLSMITFAASMIYSQALILSAGPLFPVSAVIALVFLAAFCFPRTAAFPLIIIGGLFTVWLGCAFLRFPLAGPEGVILASVSQTSEGGYSVSRSGPAKDALPDGGGTLSLKAANREQPLGFTALILSFDPRWPLIGGQNRGAVTEIRLGDDSFPAASPGAPFFRRGAARYDILLPPESIRPGMVYSVRFDGASLTVQSGENRYQL